MWATGLLRHCGPQCLLCDAVCLTWLQAVRVGCAAAWLASSLWLLYFLFLQHACSEETGGKEELDCSTMTIKGLDFYHPNSKLQAHSPQTVERDMLHEDLCFSEKCA